MENIQQHYEIACKKESDINEHLPTLKKYAEKCDHVTEFGVRDVCSTWGLLAGIPKKMVSYDLFTSRFIGSVEKAAKESKIDYTFVESDVLTVDIEKTDLLFIDTLHTRKQLTAELNMHGAKVSRFIILHDTFTYENMDEGNHFKSKDRGLWPAITDFLSKNPRWRIRERFTNNNGLTIMEKTR